MVWRAFSSTTLSVGIAFEIIMVFMKKSFSGINVARIITAWGFFTFLGLHYVLGAPTLYDKIVKKRKISEK